ncbi:MAG: endonuclease III [Erysipelotrichaceae bacterium]
MDEKANYIYTNLEKMYPDARCELEYATDFQLLIAVVLSAQTTDKAVNKVTKTLFEKFPDCYSLALADKNEVIDCIRSIGLYQTKAKNIIAIARQISEKYQGSLPKDFDELTSLAGVGRKTANVVLSQLYDYQGFAVDTHVNRVSKRLNIAQENDSVEEVEKKLCQLFDSSCWHRLHHLFIFFGRYKCKSRNPECHNCPFTNMCNYYLKNDKDAY